MKKFSIIIWALLNASLLMAQQEAQQAFPTISNHWLRTAPPNAKMLAAYGQLQNNTNQDKKLIGAFSPDFSMTEIHKTVIEDGIAKMIHQPEQTIAQHDTLTFEPGGLHIMLMHPKRKIVTGDSIKICLVYQQGDQEIVQHLFFPVIEK